MIPVAVVAVVVVVVVVVVVAITVWDIRWLNIYEKMQ